MVRLVRARFGKAWQAWSVVVLLGTTCQGVAGKACCGSDRFVSVLPVKVWQAWCVEIRRVEAVLVMASRGKAG